VTVKESASQTKLSPTAFPGLRATIKAPTTAIAAVETASSA
jgi:hypothetical protein